MSHSLITRRFQLLATATFCLAVLVAGTGCRNLSKSGASEPRHRLDPNEYPTNRQVRIACVGDSITFGAGVANRHENAYPIVLEACMGPRFEVRNFGVNGATLLKDGDRPYWNENALSEAESFSPDAVIIKLGTNDSKPQNWIHGNRFADDLRALIARFSALDSHPRIWLCLPVPVYQDRWGINERTVSQEIIPVIRQVAKEARIPVINLHAALSNRPDSFPDGIHPDVTGAAMMAQVICYAIKK